ncbi:hypothetical protein ACFC5E_36240, partial [Streptomyces rochei]
MAAKARQRAAERAEWDRLAEAGHGLVPCEPCGGTVLWFVLFLAQLPFYGWFDEHGHTWWVWT